MTRNSYGAGTLTYEGTLLSDALQQQVVLGALRDAGLAGDGAIAAGTVRVKSGTNRGGRAVHYLLNYGSESREVTYGFAAGHDLLTTTAVRAGAKVALGPWDLAIVEEDRAAK